MTFTLPETFQKEIAPTTQKVYKGKLNALAREGYDTPELLKTKAKEVVETIKKLTGDSDDEKARNLRRYFLSAIFWVTKLPKTNPFHTYWQSCTPLKVQGTEIDWVKRKKFTPA